MEFVGITFAFFTVLAIIAIGVVAYIAVNELVEVEEE